MCITNEVIFNTSSNKGNAVGAVGIFGECQARVAFSPAPGPTKKGLVPHFHVRLNKYRSLRRSKSGGCNNTALIQLLGGTSAGRAGCGTDLAACV